jgi:hypothetical protein
VDFGASAQHTARQASTGGYHFIDDRRLSLVVKLVASGIECLAQDPGSVVVKDDAGFFAAPALRLLMVGN